MALEKATVRGTATVAARGKATVTAMAMGLMAAWEREGTDSGQRVETKAVNTTVELPGP